MKVEEAHGYKLFLVYQCKLWFQDLKLAFNMCHTALLSYFHSLEKHSVIMMCEHALRSCEFSSDRYRQNHLLL